ncbi:hypothetical protein ANO11243_094120 [Dothideomycetidae sp. 11243]|nr:hypothetical protein ANO11243_094120 [fungal sp. No.11243]
MTTTGTTTTSSASSCSYVSEPQYTDCVSAPIGYYKTGDGGTSFLPQTCEAQCDADAMCGFIYIASEGQGFECYFYTSEPSAAVFAGCEATHGPGAYGTGYLKQCSGGSTTTATTTTTTATTTTTTTTTTSPTPRCSSYVQEPDFEVCHSAPPGYYNFYDSKPKTGTVTDVCERLCSADSRCNFIFVTGADTSGTCYVYMAEPGPAALTTCIEVLDQPGSGYLKQCSSATTTTTTSTTITTTTASPTSTTCSYAVQPQFAACLQAPLGAYRTETQAGSINDQTAICEAQCSADSICVFVYARTDNGDITCSFYSQEPSNTAIPACEAGGGPPIGNGYLKQLCQKGTGTTTTTTTTTPILVSTSTTPTVTPTATTSTTTTTTSSPLPTCTYDPIPQFDACQQAPATWYQRTAAAKADPIYNCELQCDGENMCVFVFVIDFMNAPFCYLYATVPNDQLANCTNSNPEESDNRGGSEKRC